MSMEIVKKLYEKKDLSELQTEDLFNDVFKGDISPILLSAILVALKIKGEKPEEIAGAAKSMRQYSVKPAIFDDTLIDTCGTGGDNSHSFNISSATAIIVNALGCSVAKHGNRSITSKSGSADFYEALSIPINITGEDATKYFEKNSFLFMFAPNYHPAMKFAMPVRKELKTRTIFNYLGPLTNPASTKRQIIGVFHPDFLPLYAETASKLDFDKVILYSGKSGMDEISPFENTIVYEVKQGNIEQYEIDPTKYISAKEAESIPSGMDAKENAKIFKETITSGEESPLAKLLALNAALALKCAADNDDMEENYNNAMQAIKDGTVNKKLEELKG